MTAPAATTSERPRLQTGASAALGIDVGGTKIAGAIVNLRTGTIAARRQVATDFGQGGGAVLAKVAEMARGLAGDAARQGTALLGLGVGVAELVDPRGAVFSAHRIAWKGIDVQSQLSRILPARLDADVRTAALAEARYGAGRQWRDFLYVTVGTGISAVSVRDGQPYVGANGAALVIANGLTQRRCPVCGHVDEQTLEEVASGPGLVAASGGTGTAEDVLAAAAAGDRRAISAIDHATAQLGAVIALLVNSLDPAAVIIGGGLGSAPGRYWTSLREAITAGVWDGFERELHIVQAELGPDSGLIGAAATLDDRAMYKDHLPHPKLRHETAESGSTQGR